MYPLSFYRQCALPGQGTLMWASGRPTGQCGRPWAGLHDSLACTQVPQDEEEVKDKYMQFFGACDNGGNGRFDFEETGIIITTTDMTNTKPHTLIGRTTRSALVLSSAAALHFRCSPNQRWHSLPRPSGQWHGRHRIIGCGKERKTTYATAVQYEYATTILGLDPDSIRTAT